MNISAPQTLSADHDLSAFSCGKPLLDIWLRGRALLNQQRGFTAVTVVCYKNRVIGYYGLSPTAVSADSLPRKVRTGQPPDPIPCLLLGQFAVDLDYRGHGIASGLLKNAYTRCIEASRLVGGRALIVNAVDEDATKFWLHQGFNQSRLHSAVLYRAMHDIAYSLTNST